MATGFREVPAGRDFDDVIDELRAKRTNDVRWADGRTFGLVFDGGAEVHRVAEAAAMMYLHENALNPIAFPSLGHIQSEVIDWTLNLLNAPAEGAGFMTSGGTESILCAVKAAKDRARAEKGIDRPQMIVPESGHAAFHKAAHDFEIEMIQTPVLDDWTADVGAMAAAVTDRTVLMVGSAPQYPQGVVDPIPEIAALAATVDANCHVDACMGGFVLPFVERLGRHVPPWDFRVPGVTSISADVHKLGYSPKGASTVLYSHEKYRKYQIFIFDKWLGGFYASPNIQGSRSGSPLAAAWAVISHLGLDGYMGLTESMLTAADQMRLAIGSIDGIKVMGDGEYHLIAMTSDASSDAPLDIYRLGDALAGRGWHADRQGPPPSIHHTVSAGNVAVVDRWIADLGECAEEVRSAEGEAGDGSGSAYSALE